MFTTGPCFFNKMAAATLSFVALLHFNGASGSTTFTDQSGKIWTAASGAKLAAGVIYGTGAGSFNGTTDYIYTPSHTDFDFGSGAWKIEASINLTAVPASGYGATIASRLAASNYTWWWWVNNNAGTLNLTFYYSTNGTSFNVINIPWTPTSGVTYDLAISADGAGNLRMFVNGTQIGATQTITGSLFTGSSRLTVAATDLAGPYFLNGYIDELRISKGVAITANYTTSLPFPNA